MIQQGSRIESSRVSNPADSPRRDACKFPIDGVVALKNFLFREKQADEGFADVAEADQRKIVYANGGAPR